MQLHIVRAPHSTTNTVKYFVKVVQNSEFKNCVRNQNGRQDVELEWMRSFTELQFKEILTTEKFH